MSQLEARRVSACPHLTLLENFHKNFDQKIQEILFKFPQLYRYGVCHKICESMLQQVKEQIWFVMNYEVNFSSLKLKTSKIYLLAETNEAQSESQPERNVSDDRECNL